MGSSKGGKGSTFGISSANVGSWLVARFAIVANFLQIILKPMYCLEGSLLLQKKMGDFFLAKKQPVIAERKTFFPKAIAKFKLQAFPKGANPLLNPY